MPSFDAIICMDWLVKYKAVIVCAEKIVRIPCGNETLIIHGNGSNQGNEVEDKSEKKRLEDVPIVQDFPDVSPEDLPGLPPVGLFVIGVGKMRILRGMKKWARQKSCAVAPILALPEGSKRFHRRMRCFKKKGLGGVLMPNEDKKQLENAKSWRKYTYVRMDPLPQLEGDGYLVMASADCDHSVRRRKSQIKSISIDNPGSDRKWRTSKGQQDCWYNLKIPDGGGEENITMDFVTSLLRRLKVCYNYGYIMGSTPKSAIFTPMRETDPLDKLARLYLKEVVTRHGIPVSIICDRDPRFASNFWRALSERFWVLDFGIMSTSVHPQTSGKAEQTYSRLSRIDGRSFEALYSRKCRSPICWTEVGEAQILGLELIQETTEKIIQIKQRMQAARDRQKVMPSEEV
ncbi:putative reverse transcriptase domain-containing protein [Tanacetum coccineum]|uniref:Reverse transcriptase domain-containing protein n=1 Tax=Tanacetum coccineum TaxID=301880 RepID=A0ABQ5BE71_9ASTR